MKTINLLGAALAAVLSSGCTSGLLDSKQPVRQTFMIAASPGLEAQAASGAVLAVDLTVARPTTRPGLESERIAVLYPDRRLDYYSAAGWGASADIVLQSLLVESLRNTGRLRTVQNDISAFSSNYLLQTDLKDFQAEYSGVGATPTVRITLVCTIGQVRGRAPIGSYSETAAVRADADNLRAVIAAFEAAYREAAASVVARTLAALEADSFKRPPLEAGPN